MELYSKELEPRPEYSLEDNILISDCTICDKKKVPFGMLGYATPEGEYIIKYYSACCKMLVDKPEKVYGYVSEADIEESEWAGEL